MPLDPSCAGRSYAAPAQVLDRARHRSYAEAVSGKPQAETDFARPLACFASVYLLWPLVPQLFADPEVGIDASRLLHGEQEFRFERPLAFDEEIRPEGTISKAEIRRGMGFIEFNCQGRDASGQVVAHSRSLFVVRGES